MPINQSRRHFLKAAGVAGTLPLLSSRLVFAQTGARPYDVLVVLFQRGGMDGLNVVVPCGDSAYYDRRRTVSISEADALDLPGQTRFGLHPSMQPLLPLYQAGELALVHAVGAPTNNRSHFSCQNLIERAVFDGSGLSSGWLNRHLVSRGPAADFQGVGFGTAVQRSLSGPAPVLGMGPFDEFALHTDSPRIDELGETLRLLHPGSTGLDAVAQTAFSAMTDLRNADPGQYPPANGANYPATPFGNELLQVAQLIKSNMGLEVATVDIGGWDHHDDELNRLTPLLSEFAQGIAAFRADLGSAMNRVVLISMSEFGRRVVPNASGGTDHGSANCLFALGGGVLGGNVYADWPGLDEADLADGDLAITTDYRVVLRELLRKRRGETALADVFPGYTDPRELGMFRA
ncbi:MAG TPA: DUF1501 domain-containing protein [Tahibacter sp.]|uniref:DUF1501 domain-containing protein n=1 Tax=Tahibacter sp. TaxID=2056211 RepID=UPI002D040EE4|nr:DUF1501 domain-containing protein [Tahibacter sp.]HSX63030.1 DUF1501 domain-containing protein [Tahibacter sp.]